jgi:cysteine synthase A
MHAHISDAIKAPQIVRLRRNLFVARFETMKVYSTVAAVDRLLREGRVRRGDTLLDSSSGIYAYALALACHKFGMRCHIVASKTVDRTLMMQLQVLGATVQQVPPQDTLKMDQSLRVAIIGDILRERPDVHWMRQYHDDIHYAGYVPVADSIAHEIGTDRLTVVGGVGSGCSTGGLAVALRDHDPSVELIGVQPYGSVTFGSERIEDPGIIIAGIGSSIPFQNVRHALYDAIHWVAFDHGLSGAVALLREHALFAGLSSGCAYLVAEREARLRPDRDVLFIAADTGHRYVEHVFAQHERALPLQALSPRVVHALDELSLPWSVMAWGRRPWPADEASLTQVEPRSPAHAAQAACSAGAA